MAEATREMTLQEWVETLPETHRARREFDALTEANRWIPVEERLPAPSQKVLGVPRGFPGQVDSGLWGVDFDEATHSHWRAPPKGPEA